MAISMSVYPEPLSIMNSDIGFFHERSEVDDALLGFCDASDFTIESLLDLPVDLLLSESKSSLLPSPDSPLISYMTDFYSTSEEFDIYQSPKLPWCCGEMYHPSNLILDPTPFATPVAELPPSDTLPEFLADFVAPSDVIANPPVYNVEKKANDGCLSAQSVAARKRRKRISEKTQELGRLIPGGNKMNTAEMLQAAYKYIKFMSAQVGLLRSIQGCKGSAQSDEYLYMLLSSTSIQEKLYSEGRCIVPKDVVELLMEDCDIKSNILISRELGCFVKSNDGRKVQQ